jgi:hypothetical protein
LGLGFFLGVVEAEVGMMAGAWGATAAAIGETEKTEGYAVVWTERRHTSLLRFGFEIWTAEKETSTAKIGCATTNKNKNAGKMCRRYDTGLKRNASRDREA